MPALAAISASEARTIPGLGGALAIASMRASPLLSGSVKVTASAKDSSAAANRSRDKTGTRNINRHASFSSGGAIASHRFDEAVENLFDAGGERDFQFFAFHRADFAVAEFLMEHFVADLESGRRFPLALGNAIALAFDQGGAPPRTRGGPGREPADPNPPRGALKGEVCSANPDVRPR